MKNKKLIASLIATLTIALFSITPVMAAGSETPYGSHTPTDTGIDSFDAFYAVGFVTFSLGTTLLSVASYTKTKIANQ